MKKNITNLILIIILIPLISFAVFKYTPLSSSYYYSQGKNLYDSELYSQAAGMFEKGLKTNPDDEPLRYYYALSLSKMEPTYSVQEKLYRLAKSENVDSAQQFAKSQLLALKNKLTEDFDGNYILKATSGKDVIHWNIEDFPLKVYIDRPDDIPDYYILSIENALTEWQNRTDFITFELVDNEKSADISLLFNTNNKDCGEDGCQYVAATTEHDIDTGNILKKMVITFFKTNPYGEDYSENEIHHTALHEIGHALGIMGHSDDVSDLMYADTKKLNDDYNEYRPQTLNFSVNDIKTITLLYKLYPTVTNSKIENKEQYWYAPFILGSDDELLKAKLQEYLQYIEHYPEICGGYINISTVYSDLGQYDKALEMLDKAQGLSSNNDEKFLIEYNRAMIYYDTQKFDKSRTYANEALRIKDDDNLRELLEVLNKVNQ